MQTLKYFQCQHSQMILYPPLPLAKFTPTPGASILDPPLCRYSLGPKVQLLSALKEITVQTSNHLLNDIQ